MGERCCWGDCSRPQGKLQGSGGIFSNLCSSGQTDLHEAAAGFVIGVGDGQLTVVAGDDLLTHGQTDAAAPCGGAALIKLIFDVGQLVGGDAGAVVPDGDDNVAVIWVDGGVDALAGSTVLGGVVQEIAEDLAQAVGVAGDGGELLFAVGVVDGDALGGQA